MALAPGQNGANTGGGSANPLRASRGAKPSEVYQAAVQHLESALSDGKQGTENGSCIDIDASVTAKASSRPPSGGLYRKRNSHEGFRPGALEALETAPQPCSDARSSSHAAASSSGIRRSSEIRRSNLGRAPSVPRPDEVNLEATNRSLSLPVTDDRPLGEETQPPPVSPAAANAPQAISRNLTAAGAASVLNNISASTSRPPSSRLRYETGEEEAPRHRPDAARVRIPKYGAASSLRRSKNGGIATPDSNGGRSEASDLMSYLERLNSTLQKGGGATDILATSQDAGGPPSIRRRPSIKILSRPESGSRGQGPIEGQAVSRAQQLLTQESLEPAVSSPKGPFSKSAQMLVDAVRSKDDHRLHEVLNHLRGFGGEAVHGIDDRHAVTGRTALHEAVMLNRLTSVEILLQAGADPNVGHSTQGPPLLHAAAWGETALVEAMVLCASDISAVDCAEYTALHYASVGDHVETAKVLVQHGAPLDALTDEGQSPLDLAASEAMHSLLLAAAASPVKSKCPGAKKATDQEVKAALERLRSATPDSAAASPSSNSFASPSTDSSPGRAESSRQLEKTSANGATLVDIIAHLDEKLVTESSRAIGAGFATGPTIQMPTEEDFDGTPPLLQDVSPPHSPTHRSPNSRMLPKSRTAGTERAGTPPPMLATEEIIRRPSSGNRGMRSSRPGTGNVFDVSGKSISNPLAAAAAARTAAAVGTTLSGLNTRAAQMFYQSVEMVTGEVHWTRGELLGEGAYGKVFAGLNQLTGELMAVKVLPLSTQNENAEQRSHLEALEHELGMYRKFQHRHIVGYIAAHMDFKTNTMYMFLEYVPGGSIASMLERFGAFSEELTRKYTRELLMGLEYLHGCKVIHRDLKGGNVLVTRNGRVKLADFGASKAYHEATITDGMKSIRGSIFWMAPEVIKGTGYGRRADIWSVGCTVLEMLTGKHPWPDLDNHWSAMFAIARAKGGPPIPDGTSPVCRDFLSCCLQVEARKRPTATELLQHPFVSQIPDALREAEMARGLNHSL